MLEPVGKNKKEESGLQNVGHQRMSMTVELEYDFVLIISGQKNALNILQ